MPPLTNIKEEKGKELTTIPLPPSIEDIADAAVRKDTQEALNSPASGPKDQAAGVWGQAKEILKERLSEEFFALWIAPMTALMTGEKLTLDCPDQYYAIYVERHFKEEIECVLQHFEITDVSFSSGEKKRLIQQEKEKERRQRQEEGRRQVLANLPLKEQFKLLISIFPRKENGFPGIRDWTDKLHRVWNVFQNMSRRGELPEATDLLKELEARKQSAEWRQAEGQYILSPDKWLAGKTTKRPWL